MAVKDITDKMVCLAYEEAKIEREKAALLLNGKYEYPYDILMRVTGQCLKVCYRAMERSSGRGYVEYGVSLRTGWLTEKGKALLEPNV